MKTKEEIQNKLMELEAVHALDCKNGPQHDEQITDMETLTQIFLLRWVLDLPIFDDRKS